MTKLPRRLGGESPERSAIRAVRAAGPGCRRGCVSSTRIRLSGDDRQPSQSNFLNLRIVFSIIPLKDFV